MTLRSIASSVLACMFLYASCVHAQQAEIDKVIEIGKTDNKVQDHLDYLTNRIGPRLTGSEGLQAACEWAKDEFAKMGLESRLEQWGEFPVGFERGPSQGALVSPKKMKLEFGTNAVSYTHLTLPTIPLV